MSEEAYRKIAEGLNEVLEENLRAEYEAAYKNYTGSFPSFEQFLRMKQTKVRRG